MAKTKHSTTTRRAVLAGAAALPALSLPALAIPAQVDPVFAAIERLRRLYAEWTANIHREPSSESPEYNAWDQENGDTCHAYNRALDEFIATKPTTRAGAAALIAFCLADECGKFGSDNEHSDCRPTRALLRTLAAAIPTLDEAVQS